MMIPLVPLPTFLLDQLSHPSGRFAPITGLLLNGVNAKTIFMGVQALELRPGQRALEIGFGGGLSLPLLLRGVGGEGQVFALEASEAMLRIARRRHLVARLQGRLRVERARIEALPLGDRAFDAIMTLNTIPFWEDVDVAMGELGRVLLPGGRLVLGIADPKEVREGGFTQRGFRAVEPDKFAAKLEAWGFEAVRQERTPDGTTLVIADRSASTGDDDW